MKIFYQCSSGKEYLGKSDTADKRMIVKEYVWSMQTGSHMKGKGKPKEEKNKPSSQILGVICIFYKTHEKKKKEKEGERMRKGERRTQDSRDLPKSLSRQADMS